METEVSKSRFKARALEFMRQVQRTGQALVITDHGHRVLKIVPFQPDLPEASRSLLGTVSLFDRPTDPVAEREWGSPR